MFIIFTNKNFTNIAIMKVFNNYGEIYFLLCKHHFLIKLMKNMHVIFRDWLNVKTNIPTFEFYHIGKNIYDRFMRKEWR